MSTQQPSSPSGAALCGQHIVNYRLVRLLGEGEMDMVYEAVHVTTGGHAAIKILRPEGAGRHDITTRFFNEARAASSISHPSMMTYARPMGSYRHRYVSANDGDAMPPQARVGDSSHMPADAHGCPACPHTAVGPAIQGSPNVFVNGRPTVRVGDKGIHTACCGPNMWNAKTGSRSVLINGRAAHRLQDLVKHCGGVGRTIEGSSNVIVGDLSSGHLFPGLQVEKTHWKQYIFVDEQGLPVVGLQCEIQIPGGEKFMAITDKDGKIRVDSIEPGQCKITFLP